MGAGRLEEQGADLALAPQLPSLCSGLQLPTGGACARATPGKGLRGSPPLEPLSWGRWVGRREGPGAPARLGAWLSVPSRATCHSSPQLAFSLGPPRAASRTSPLMMDTSCLRTQAPATDTASLSSAGGVQWGSPDTEGTRGPHRWAPGCPLDSQPTPHFRGLRGPWARRCQSRPQVPPLQSQGSPCGWSQGFPSKAAFLPARPPATPAEAVTSASVLTASQAPQKGAWYPRSGSPGPHLASG